MCRLVRSASAPYQAVVRATTYVLDGYLYFGDDIYDRDDSLEREVPTTTSAGA